MDDGEDAFRQANVIKGLGGRTHHHHPHRVSQADIFPGQDNQAAEDEAGVFPGVEHLCQPVKGRIWV